jgi:chorismate lyase
MWYDCKDEFLFTTNILIMPPSLLTSSVSVPFLLQPWLVYTDSLTEKLRKESGEASLTVLSQSRVQASWWDRSVLGLSMQSVTQRQIVMSARKHICWYARTIIPDNTYKMNETFFERLRQESLGSLIFNDGRVKRYSLVNYAIDSQCIEYYWFRSFVNNSYQTFWARLSVFTIDVIYPFFLIEILLPGLIIALEEARI